MDSVVSGVPADVVVLTNVVVVGFATSVSNVSGISAVVGFKLIPTTLTMIYAMWRSTLIQFSNFL
jgi:hypothetical protein